MPPGTPLPALPRKKRSNTRLASDGWIPGPSSSTRTMPPPFCETVTETVAPDGL